MGSNHVPPTATDKFNLKKIPSTDYNQSMGGFLLKFIRRWGIFLAVGGRYEQSIGGMNSRCDVITTSVPSLM